MKNRWMAWNYYWGGTGCGGEQTEKYIQIFINAKRDYMSCCYLGEMEFTHDISMVGFPSKFPVTHYIHYSKEEEHNKNGGIK